VLSIENRDFIIDALEAMPIEIARATNPLIFIRDNCETAVQTDGVLIVGNWTPTTSLFSKDTQTPDDANLCMHRYDVSTDTDDLDECFQHLSRELDAAKEEDPVNQADIDVLHAELFQEMHELVAIDAQYRSYTPIPTHPDLENEEVPPYTITHFGDGRAPVVELITPGHSVALTSHEFVTHESPNLTADHMIGIDGTGRCIIGSVTIAEPEPEAAPPVLKMGRNKVPQPNPSENSAARSSTD
jgi:hypothetical protein